MKPAALLHLKNNVVAVLIGGAGGLLFSLADLPLAWMLGAMFATTAAAILGIQVEIYKPLRTTMIAVLGVLLGSAFHPSMLEQMSQWAAGAAVVACYVPIGALLVYLYFRHVGGFDPVTAYFASSPGGFGEMVIMGEEMGGDAQVISLAHATRILMVVFLVPVFYRFVVGLDVPTIAAGDPLAALGMQDLALLVLCGALGWPLAARLRIPAAALIGPVLLSAAVHLGGLTASKPPVPVIAVSQLIIGASVGARFAGVDLRKIARVPLLSMGATVILLVVAAIFTLLFAGPVGLGPVALNLALAPGGLAEMSLIALALGIDTAFVSSMHILRIALIYIAAPLGFRLFGKKAPEP